MPISNRHCLFLGTQTRKTLTLRCRFPGLNAPVCKIASAKSILAPQAESAISAQRTPSANCQKIIFTFKTDYFGDRKTALFWRENKFKIEINLSQFKLIRRGIRGLALKTLQMHWPTVNQLHQSNDRPIDLPIRGLINQLHWLVTLG